MSDWAAKRFWTNAEVGEGEGGWRIRLDGRAVRTPAGAALSLPTERLARVVASEWDAQGALIDPATMPMTRTANTAIDKVGPQREAIVSMLCAYGATDLLCYRADGQMRLAARQAELWDPVLDWAARRFCARLTATRGVMPVEQDRDAIARLEAPMRDMSPFRLAAFHDMVVLTGSLVLAHAAAEGHLSISEAWRLSRVDEDWQAADWGRDEEAEQAAARRRADFLEARRFWDLAD